MYLNGIPIAMSDANGRYYLHSDHLGTPKVMTDSQQDIVWQATHTAFGEATTDEDPDGDGVNVRLNIRFPGQYYDEETNLHYNWHRYYDSSIGRYITSDPIGLDGGINTYGYALQNPVGFYDPNGEAVQLGPVIFAAEVASAITLCMKVLEDGINSFGEAKTASLQKKATLAHSKACVSAPELVSNCPDIDNQINDFQQSVSPVNEALRSLTKGASKMPSNPKPMGK